ncbi:GPR endopeptidase [Alicyclobacillus sendaiensis]|uniref:Germination protease n=1 Tax=Alicyclobacillus sendaiensis PA2 TaxID=3029425 RepID=A0ABT6XW85_ALISE|nr:GPR endopeptidase [Alicyclobacillus sendaiensis]MDI9259348.1 GPR endopeptidase [Alicyclobacillus sendaiensis PA2]
MVISWNAARRVRLKPCHLPVSRSSPRTDLAVEARELALREGRIRGVDEEREEHEGVVIRRVRVSTQVAARRLGKRKGTYITIEAPGLRRRDFDLEDRLTCIVAEELKRLLPERAETALVIGLGNEHVTADALGPMVVNRLFVTRHLFSYMPEVLGGGEGYRSIAALAPGVLGLTGIETSEIVLGVVERLKPDVVLAVDALAARSLERLHRTIQLSDAGIQPGAGVGNHRKAIDQETLGVPVLAIGVPTVVDAATIASDAIELVFRELGRQVPGNAANRLLDQLTSQEKWQLVREVLEPVDQNLVVAPKEVDEFMENVAYLLAKSMNVALHPAMTFEDADLVTH